jgi:pseudouridine-5'-phosphate glycosidase
MELRHLLEVRPEVAVALAEGRAVVALESTVIAHGLPWPVNLETARALEATIRAEGAIPATIAVWQGRPIIGLNDEELTALARSRDVLKASSRDLGWTIAQRRTAATTVAATMRLAALASIRLFATGGIGGAHPPGDSWDISADVRELARTAVAVVCAGAKSVLDIPRTLEILETEGVPVLGYGVEQFPAFYVRSSGEPVAGRVDTPEEAAATLAAHWVLGGAGVVLAQAVDESVALGADECNAALARAEDQARQAKVRGPALTPFLLARLAEITQGRTLQANRALLLANVRLAARVALAFAQRRA